MLMGSVFILPPVDPFGVRVVATEASEVASIRQCLSFNLKCEDSFDLYQRLAVCEGVGELS